MPRLFLNSDLDRCVGEERWGQTSMSWPCHPVPDGHLAHASGVSHGFLGVPNSDVHMPSVSDWMSALSCSFLVTPQGCSVTLACGVRLQFPAGATATPVSIRYRLRLPEPRLVPLGPHDSLLSHVLELQPHGVAFQQARPEQVRGGVQVMRAQAWAQRSRHPCLAGGGPVAALCAPAGPALP